MKETWGNLDEEDKQEKEDALKNPDEFMERITDIFLYQMEKRHGNRLKWKMVYKMLNKMI